MKTKRPKTFTNTIGRDLKTIRDRILPAPHPLFPLRFANIRLYKNPLLQGVIVTPQNNPKLGSDSLPRHSRHPQKPRKTPGLGRAKKYPQFGLRLPKYGRKRCHLLAARARLTEVIFAAYFCPFEGRKSIVGAIARLFFWRGVL